MEINSDARAIMNRWRTNLKNAERRILNFHERVGLRLESLLERATIDREPLREWQIRQVYFRDVGEYEDIDADFRSINVGDTWGGRDVSAFFRRDITIPERMAGKRVFLNIYLGGDSLLSLDGVPYHGLDPFRNTVLLAESAIAGKSYNVEIESYIHWYTSPDCQNVFSAAQLVAIDAEVEAAYWDFVAAFKVLLMNNIDERLNAFLEKHLWEALLAIPVHEPDFTVIKKQLLDIQAEFRRTVFESDHFKASGLLHLVGHSHLDIVYVWPYREYVRKVGRTHATMLRLLEQYPDFKFSQSSAKIYADMKAFYPAIYAQVKQRIAEGRWQPVGAFWLETDCNLVSGESFVRHILHGQRFWQEEFGFQSRVCWLPDVFGLTWALPQILKRSKIDVILTNKHFVWNDTNPWRQNTFWWEGVDGSRVLAVIPPGHFIGMVDPDHMDQYWRDFSDKETVGEMIYTYGWGDGGGGVDPEMLECATRYADFPGLVPTQFANPEDALLSIADQARQTDLPVWRDELYLETHRGTYTTKGRLKKLNRQSEILYRQVELLASLAWLDGHEYPQDTLYTGWRSLLNTHFHDALPGPHITEVYHYLLGEYDALQGIAGEIQETAGTCLFGENSGDNILVFNSLLNERKGIITVPADLLQGKQLAGETGKPLVQQRVQNLDGTNVVLVQIDGSIPSVGYRIFEVTNNPADSAIDAVSVQKNVLENQYLRAEFADNGELISLWDKEIDRPILADGERGNKFQIYEDVPGKYDAWDIVASYVEHELPLVGNYELSVDETGPLRASLKLVHRCYDSTISQRISLTADSRKLTFETEIDWHERQRLLKVGFPLAIRSQTATYDVAYGNIERPAHRNTSFDAARFEVPAHWWMDMSETGYGVALLNDCKYGHEANGHWIRLTLLKGSISPDPVSDQEIHHFTYVLYPHLGDWREGNVLEAAATLNMPLHTRRTQLDPKQHCYVYYDAPNVTMEAMKRSEDGNHLILRLVEQHNALTRTTLNFDRRLESASSCDLMENVEHDLPVNGKTLQIELNPCEIVTLRLRFG